MHSALHLFIFVGLCCLVNSNNPYLIHTSYYNRPSPAFYYPQYPQDNYFVSQSRQVQSYAMPKWSSDHHQKQGMVQQQRPQYRVWTYQNNNLHRWPLTNSYFNGNYNQQVQSESYNRPIYRKQNHIKKSSMAGLSYNNKKMQFLENKKKKSQPVCKTSGETCYGWEPYIPENCCKGYVCDHNTKSIVGICVKKVVTVKPMTSKQSNIVQRPLTTEELLAGGA